MRILIGLLSFLSVSISAFGQADCVTRFTYTWTTDSLTANKFDVGLPTTPFLVGYANKDDERSFYFVDLNSKTATMSSHLSSDFCMDRESIIERVFRGDKSFYLLKLRTTTNEKRTKLDVSEIKIPVDAIVFSVDSVKRTINIQLPKINTH
jgi:hypothetical protein